MVIVEEPGKSQIREIVAEFIRPENQFGVKPVPSWYNPALSTNSKISHYPGCIYFLVNIIINNIQMHRDRYYPDISAAPIYPIVFKNRIQDRKSTRLNSSHGYIS